jgi:NADH:ubiquinone oxidoreductase subunit 5 (subunit L)/multisubunit Na+/H+ antiporter MnhA subunit
VKAFLTVRVGDVAFLFGVFTLGSRSAASASPRWFERVDEIPPGR